MASSAGPFLSIVIPAYNEERRIPGALERVLDYLKGQAYEAEVLVVDDGSTDGTAEAVRRFQGGRPPVRLIVPRQALAPAHRGKGHAVRTGMLAATGRFRFQCDADLAMPIEQLARFLPPQLTDVDVAVGSREAPGARRYAEPPYRHLMGRVFNGVVRALAVRGVRDTQCGFKCFRGAIVQHLFGQQRLDGFGSDVEVLYLAQRSGLRVVEVPIDGHHHRESKVRPVRDTVTMLRETVQVRWNHLRGRYRTSFPSAEGEDAAQSMAREGRDA